MGHSVYRAAGNDRQTSVPSSFSSFYELDEHRTNFQKPLLM
jgi:hypothetical protein